MTQGFFLLKGFFLSYLLGGGHKCLKMIVEGMDKVMLFTKSQNNMFFCK